jgi:3-oxoacyl-[acyl-carrier protein] reductase
MYLKQKGLTTMLDTGLKDRVVLVTGGNHGIGAATAKAFAAQGAKVFITYLCVQPSAEIDPDEANTPGMAMYSAGRARDAAHVVEAIRGAGGEADSWEADLSDPAVIPALYDRVEAVFGPADVVVNNAAHWEPATFIPSGSDLYNDFVTQWLNNPVETITAGNHDRAFAVNARAVALMMAEFARRQVQRGATWGRVINISTDGAYCFPTEVTYGASKLAMEAYSRAAAAELGQFGITVNIVSPGPIQTGYIIPAMEAAIDKDTPLGRVGLPEDVADVIVFLASEQARWLTGQTLHVGGGHRM